MRRIARMLRKGPLVLFCAALAAVAMTQTTTAYLFDTTEPVRNKFEYIPVINTTIDETFEQETPLEYTKEVRVQNTASGGITPTAAAYARVLLVPVFRDENGSRKAVVDWSTYPGTVSIQSPDDETQFLTLAFGGAEWFHAGDGIFYYTRPLLPGGDASTNLLESVTATDAALWESFQLEVLADSVIATEDAVTAAWGAAIWQALTGGDG